ncbi:hypothetical protein B296_00029549, partial [Ensete ventricosum]
AAPELTQAMASPSTISSPLLILLLLLIPSVAFEFDVGDETGWAVPPEKKAQLYNQWASRNRFQVGDTVRFEYKKDSVMVVSEEDYGSCRSSHPIFFSNSGETEYKLSRPGLFYFISGVSGHCERGQKMIIKVMSHPEPPPGSNQTGDSTSPASPDRSTAAAAPAVASLVGMAAFVLLMTSSLFE